MLVHERVCIKMQKEEQKEKKKEMEELQEGRKHHDSIIGVKTKNQIILQ